jgi:DNA-directed RNA polymerase subunit RPC12/RpoP
MNIRTADGASHEGRDASGNEIFKVSMPLDDEGYFGRECPSCHQIFRIHSDDYDALPDDLVLTCPYCGHRDEHSTFMTTQQKDRADRVAFDFANQMISDMLDKSFGSLARSTRNNKFVKISYRSKPFFPEPLPGINEERLIRERTCPTCGVRYAVFGEHRFCPVSGALDPADIARDALAAESAKLDAMSEIPEPQRSALREQGVLDRIAVDTLSRVVGVVETLASAQFNERVENAATLLKGKGNVFQRLDDLADLFDAHHGIEARTAEGVDWPTLKRLWAARHSHVHADGLVDEKYLKAVPSTSLKPGQRVVVTETDARTAIAQAGALCAALGPFHVDLDG